MGKGSGVRNILKTYLILGVIALAAIVLATAVVLRLAVVSTWPPVESNFVYGDRNCFRPVPGSTVTYHRHGMMDKPVIHEINRLGFRGPVPGPQDRIRIAVVGDAVVYGSGVAQKSSIPAVLEADLKERFPDAGIRVYNLGFPGFNLEEQAAEFARLQGTIRPDAIVLLVNGNYSDSSACARAALPARNLLRRYSSFWNLLEAGIEDSSLNGAKMFSLPPMEHAVGVLLNRFRRPGAERLLVLLSNTPDLRTEPGSNIPFGTVAAENGFQVLDLSEAVDPSSGGRAKLNTEDDLKPDVVADAARRIADILTPVVGAKIADRITESGH